MLKSNKQLLFVEKESHNVLATTVLIDKIDGSFETTIRNQTSVGFRTLHMSDKTFADFYDVNENLRKYCVESITRINFNEIIIQMNKQLFEKFSIGFENRINRYNQ